MKKEITAPRLKCLFCDLTQDEVPQMVKHTDQICICLDCIRLCLDACEQRMKEWKSSAAEIIATIAQFKRDNPSRESAHKESNDAQ